MFTYRTGKWVLLTVQLCSFRVLKRAMEISSVNNSKAGKCGYSFSFGYSSLQSQNGVISQHLLCTGLMSLQDVATFTWLMSSSCIPFQLCWLLLVEYLRKKPHQIFRIQTFSFHKCHGRCISVFERANELMPEFFCQNYRKSNLESDALENAVR